MVPPITGSARRGARSSSALEVAEYFAPQRTPTTDLPDPVPLLANLGSPKDAAGAVELGAEGEDEAQAVDTLTALIESGFGEL